MPSTNKTPFLSLNKFIGTDKPKMADFNYDNQQIDSKMQAHCENVSSHLSDNDRQKLDSLPFTVGSYIGDGEEIRDIELPFIPTLGFLYGVDAMCFDYSNIGTAQSNGRFGFFSAHGCNFGIELLENGIRVLNVSMAADGRAVKYNWPNQKYVYILIR